jgi:GGDEF domain-containing protein
MLVHASQVLSRKSAPAISSRASAATSSSILALTMPAMQRCRPLAGRIIEQMRQPIDFQGFACRCGVSIGIALASGMASMPARC